MKIYTRTGDKGSTSLFSGDRVAKNHPFIEALGTVDEGNSAIGFAYSLLPDEENVKQCRQQLNFIQHALFDIGAALATPRTSHQEQKIEKTSFDQNAIIKLEKWIDDLDQSLPKLTAFILPGGHPAAAALHLARSIIRRSERLVVSLFEEGHISHSVLIYLNRLSDYLFMLSRSVNQLLGVAEIKWQPKKSSD
jgi:cob(I)alamin adenosyltransferase